MRLEHPELLQIAPELGRIDEMLRRQTAGARGRNELGHVVEINHPAPGRAQADRALEDLRRRLGVADFVGQHQPPEFREEAEVVAYVIEMQRIGIG